MRCIGCGYGNPQGAKFCNQCAKPVGEQACVECGFTGALQGGLCHACSGAPSTPRSGGERRQITVLFSDLVGSTALARDLDAEDFRDLLSEYQTICRDVVTELEGYVAQYLGDGVMVYFGYPEAHEHDARRAAQAGLAILQRAKWLRPHPPMASVPRVRIGIHTGVVLMDRVGSGPERLALGEVPNLAARLQQVAEPDTVVMSENTRRLVQGYFRIEPRGELLIKGIGDPIPIYRVVGSTPVQSRAESADLETLIAREGDVAVLSKQWNNVVNARERAVVELSGEPGIGKSRLLQTFKQKIAGQVSTIEAFCSPFHRNTALGPIAHALEVDAQIVGITNLADRHSRFHAYLDALGMGEARSLLAPLVSVTLPQGAGSTELTPQMKRQRTMQSIVAWIRALGQRRPVLFAIEDLQWADPSTLEFLDLAMRDIVGEPVMFLTTHRPEFSSTWSVTPVARIALYRLPQAAAEQLITRVAGGRPLPRVVNQRIIELTDGVPLYLEEVTKSVLEAGVLRLRAGNYELHGSLPEDVLPATVRDSLMARLDRLGNSKAIAQVASMLGREFSYEVLQTVALVNEPALLSALDRLIDAGIILSEERNETRSYRFKHALIQEAAYQSLLKRDRQQYHHRVASVLRDQFPEIAEAEPDLVAQHHARANLPELAATYFERAGHLTLQAQAYAESINHFGSALRQTLKLAAHKQRDRRELEVLSGLGLPLLMTKGYASDEVAQVYDRALTLCDEVEPPIRVLYGVWTAQIVRGNRLGTERMANQFGKIAAGSRIPSERLIALMVLGVFDFWRGAIDQAIDRLKEAVACLDHQMLSTLPREYGLDNPLYGHLMLSWAELMAGRTEDSQATWEHAFTLTEAARSPYLSTMALSFGAAAARDLGDAPRALELSAKGIELATQHQLLFWLALAHMQHGSALCLAGSVTDGMTEIDHGLTLFRLTGASHPLAYYLSYLADACHRAGAIEKGLSVVEEGLMLSSRTIDQNCAPELLRLKADLLILQGDIPLAEATLTEALAISRQHGSGLWERRAASTQGRLESARRAMGLNIRSFAEAVADVTVVSARLAVAD